MSDPVLRFQPAEGPAVRLERLWARHGALAEQQKYLTTEKMALEELLESQLELGAEIIAHQEPEPEAHRRLRWEMRQETREKLHDIENGLKLLHRWKVKLRARIEEIEFEASPRSQELQAEPGTLSLQKTPLSGRAIPSRTHRGSERLSL